MFSGFLLVDQLRKCPLCGKKLEILSNKVLIEYFENDEVECRFCKENFNLFKVLIEMLNEDFALIGMHYEFLGCIHGVKTPIVKTGQFNTLNLKEEIGNGKLVSIISINPRSDNIGNVPMISAPYIYPRNLQFRDNELSIYGLPNEGEEDTEYLISYIYAPENIMNDLSNKLLIEAFKFYAEKDERNMVLSANSAVEILFNRFFNELFDSLKDENENLSNNKRKQKNVQITNFLKDGATYGYKLYPFFPLICKINGIQKLNEDILTSIKHLKDNRNKLIHKGVPKHTDKNEIKEQLIAAFLTFKYFKLIHRY